MRTQTTKTPDGNMPKNETCRPCQNDRHERCPYRSRPHKGALVGCGCWCLADTWDEARPRLILALRRLRIDAGADLNGNSDAL
jgi:hypothetical protein